MKKLGLGYWLAFIAMLIGLGFIIWGAIIYTSYPGMRAIMRAARHAAELQYIIGIACIIGSWIFLKFVNK